MNSKEFRKKGEEIVDYISDYLESILQRQIRPNVSPGYLTHLLPSTAPTEGESFEKIMEDFETCIMGGTAHWQHPNFHAFFPSNTSFPGILAELVLDATGCVAFNWPISPAGKELEGIVLDWLGEMIGLPDSFLRYASGSKGGGIVQNGSSECVAIAMFHARQVALKKLNESNPSMCKEAFITSLVAYCSEQSHSSVEKAAMIFMVSMKVLSTDEEYRLRGETVSKAIDEDKKNGLMPFFLSCTVGTTSCCACDPVEEIGPVCEANGVWLHVDAAYAGTAVVCPEYRHLLKGVEHASSFNSNPAKWMLTCVDSSALWVKDRRMIHDSLVVDKTMFSYGISENDWCHPSSRRLRVLKIWFVIRNYGVEGLQKHVRNHVRLAKMFESYVRNDSRFEVITAQLGLVCFRLKGSNTLNKRFLKSINSSFKIFVIPAQLHEKFVIRFCVSSPLVTEEDITYAWSVICDTASDLL